MSSRARLLALFPVVMAPSLIATLAVVNPPGIFLNPLLPSILNLVFRVAIPIAVAIIAARTYLVSGIFAILCLGSGFLAFGTGCVIITPLMFLGPVPSIPDVIAVHNMSALLMAVAFAASTLATARGSRIDRPHPRRRRAILGKAYAATFAVMVAVFLAVHHHLVPPFFVQGFGSTPLRELVLLCVIVLMAFSASMFLLGYWGIGTAFPFWCALGMILFTTGICGIFFETAVGSALNWASRSIQYLATLYFLMAILAARREARLAGRSTTDIIGVLFAAERERRQAEAATKASEKRYHTLFDSITEGFCIIEVLHDQAGSGADCRLLEVNPAFEDHTGIKGAVGRSLRKLVPDLEEEWFEFFRKVALTGESSRYEEYTRALGRYFEMHASRIGEQSQGLVAVVFRDVSNRHRREAELGQAKEAAEQAVAAKSKFLANMSHELRTPLNAMMGFAQILANSDIGKRHKEYATYIHDSGKALLDIVNDILDLSKVEAAKVELDSAQFRLRQVLESGLKSLEALAAKKDLPVYCAIDPEVPNNLVGDPGRLLQVMTNLVGNAIKFTERGRVAISVTLDSEPSSESVKLRFTVQDTGIGIARERLTRIFEPFTQVATSAHVLYGGTGLGLSIAKSLVELMGGTIEVDSLEDRGSTFSFTAEFGLAAETAMPRQPAMDELAARRLPQLRVMVVEDNLVNRMLTMEVLQERGHTAIGVRDGREALGRLKAEHFDLVLMDVLMPVMDGIEAIRAIRMGMAGDPHIRVVALTAFALSGDKERMLAAGMDDYLAKPVDIRELERVLHEAAVNAASTRGQDILADTA